MIVYLKLQQSYRAKPVYESSGDTNVQESYRIEIKKLYELPSEYIRRTKNKKALN